MNFVKENVTLNRNFLRDDKESSDDNDYILYVKNVDDDDDMM